MEFDGFGLADVASIMQMVFVLGCVYISMKVGMPKFGDEKYERKRRAWYLTSISSLLLSAGGLLFVYRVLRFGLSSELARSETEWDRRIAKFFCAYCVADLFVGRIDYHELLDWQAGWTHHIFYASVLLLLLARRHTNFFTAGIIEEVPTVYLAHARINSTSPTSWFFAVSYFVLRILYHTVATFEAMEHSTLAFCLGLIVLRQHLWWFAAWWRGVAEPDDPKKLLNWTLRSKLVVLASMVLVQILTMLHVSFVGYQRRAWAVSRYAAGAALVCSYFYFSFQTVAIFVDTYTQSFIKLAIAEKQLIYNISWEDPRVEREALSLSKNDVVLTLSSAGCNVLDYLCEQPEHIVVADLNEAQLAVLDLKLACMRAEMSHDDFFALWGRSDPAIFVKRYASTLRANLSRDGSRLFWDEVGDSLFADNFMFSGTSGLMAYVLMLAARPLGISGALQRNLGRPPARLADSLVFRAVSSFLAWPVVWAYLAPLIGVPPEQVALVERKPDLFSQRIIEIVQRRMWLKDNYFYHGYCTGQFDAYPKCPRYMAPDYYQALVRTQAYDKVTLFHGSWGDAPAPGNRTFTFVSLLDSMDWMPPDLVAALLSKLLADGRCDPSVRIFWRSYAPGPSNQSSRYDLFTPHSPALAQLEPSELIKYDRVGWYMSQWVATPLKTSFAPACLEPAGTREIYRNSLLDDLRICLAMVAHALRSDKDVATFYRSQGSRYDGFREALLPDRDTLLNYALPWSRFSSIACEYSLACVGCGTARDLEFIAEHLKKLGKRVALVDLSPELLAVARQRVTRLGMEHLVDFFNVDCTDHNALKPLFAKCAFVTCSYCLTMIPAWRRAVDNLVRLAVPKQGFLGVVDFTTRFNREGDTLECLYKAWFKLDGVYFDRGHVQCLVDATQPFFYAEGRSRVPYTPYYPTHYVYVGKCMQDYQATNS